MGIISVLGVLGIVPSYPDTLTILNFTEILYPAPNTLI